MLIPIATPGGKAPACAGVREGGDRAAARAPAPPPRLCRRGWRQLPRYGTECAVDRIRRALLPHHVLRRRGVLEFARYAHVRDARAPARSARLRIQGGGVGT